MTSALPVETRSPLCFRLRGVEEDRGQLESRPSSVIQHRGQRPPLASCSQILSAQRLPSPILRDYATVSTQNSPFRNYMEDMCVAILKFNAFPNDPASCSFFGVYDGHGNDFCAKYAAKYSHQILAELMLNMYRDKWKDTFVADIVATAMMPRILAPKKIAKRKMLTS